MEESREIKILQVLNEVRTKIGTIVKAETSKSLANLLSSYPGLSFELNEYEWLLLNVDVIIEGK